MDRSFPKLREKRAAAHAKSKTDRGFTLIELLVVVVILGVLIAIAIPLYLNYRKGANDASAQSDMRNAINVLEQCNSENGKYPLKSFVVPANGVVGGSLDTSCASKTINLSRGTEMYYVFTAGAPGTGYTLTADNIFGTFKVFCYDSTKGGQIAAVSATLGDGHC